MTRVDELHPKVRRILREHWDPIGIRNVPAAQDEYDAYVGPLVEKIVRGSTVDQLSRYLLATETDVMGLPADPVRARIVARMLLLI